MNVDDIIKKQTLLQEAFGFPIETDSVEEKVDLLKVYSIGALDEIHEAMHEFSWKPWAKGLFINKDAFVSEVADTMLFLFNMLAVVGACEEDLQAAIDTKTKKNFARASMDYNHNTYKCKTCKRALDDFFTVEQIEANSIEHCDSCR